MEFFRWLRWQWRQFETWQKLWGVGAFFGGAALGVGEGDLRFYLLAVPFTIFMLCTFKWWIYEPLVNSWNRYTKERDNLFNTIRGDEK